MTISAATVSALLHHFAAASSPHAWTPALDIDRPWSHGERAITAAGGDVIYVADASGIVSFSRAGNALRTQGEVDGFDVGAGAGYAYASRAGAEVTVFPLSLSVAAGGFLVPDAARAQRVWLNVSRFRPPKASWRRGWTLLAAGGWDRILGAGTAGLHAGWAGESAQRADPGTVFVINGVTAPGASVRLGDQAYGGATYTREGPGWLRPAVGLTGMAMTGSTVDGRAVPKTSRSRVFLHLAATLVGILGAHAGLDLLDPRGGWFAGFTIRQLPAGSERG